MPLDVSMGNRALLFRSINADTHSTANPAERRHTRASGRISPDMNAAVSLLPRRALPRCQEMPPEREPRPTHPESRSGIQAPVAARLRASSRNPGPPGVLPAPRCGTRGAGCIRYRLAEAGTSCSRWNEQPIRQTT
jgi:hypothetical protein